MQAIKKLLKINTKYILKISPKISLTTTTKKLTISIVITTILLTIVLSNTNQYFLPNIPQGTMLYILSIITSIITGSFVAFQYALPSKMEKLLTCITILFLPVGAMCMTECMNGIFIGNWLVFGWVFNCIFYAALYLFVFALTGNYKVPFLIVNPGLYLLSLVNHYVLSYRGASLLPADLFYISTAATVAGTYEYTLDYQVIISTILLILTLAIAVKIKTPKKKLWKHICSRILTGIISVSILLSYYTTDTLINAGFKPNFFDQENSYKVFGVAVNFYMNTRYLTTQKPEGYDTEKIEMIVSDAISVQENTTAETEKSEQQQNPNIIVIMNETLADLSLLGELKTNKDYMPFLRSLTENTVKGNLYVQVIGAGTSNTEFEFLTGMSTAFLPVGSNAYSLYIDHEISSLCRILSAYGYTTTAFHPYFKNNWNRVKAYNYIGFNKYIAIEDMFEPSVIETMQSKSDIERLENLLAEQYPDEEIIKRWYVSDSYDYKKVIEMYEGKDPTVPFFMFNVTMQNHSSYEKEYENFNQEIYLVDENGNAVSTYTKTNQYLSLIYESDKAFADLIDYFSQQTEPTIICMFGDHQPKIEDEIIANMLGASSLIGLSLEQEQSRYCTPFYIWTNYPIEEKVIDKLSVNYLSSYLMEIAGMKMPAFNQYLLNLSKTLPVINAIGYIDANGNYYRHGEESIYHELIRDYEKICYNYLFDEENTCNWLFALS